MYNTENGAAILRESAYDKGYKDGVICGKLCASQQILDDLEDLLTKKKEEFKQKANEHPEIDYPEADAFWTFSYTLKNLRRNTRYFNYGTN